MALAGGSKSFTEAEGMKLIKWAQQVRTDALIIEMMIEGKLVCRYDKDGELTVITPEGAAERKKKKRDKQK